MPVTRGYGSDVMSNNKILFVGEDGRLQKDLILFLSNLDLEIDSCDFIPKASIFAGSGKKISLIVLGLSQIQDHDLSFLRDLKILDPLFHVVVLSRATEAQALIPYLQEGLIDQVASPENFTAVYSAIKSGLARKQLAVENNNFLINLTKLKLEKSKETSKALELEEVYDTTLENLMTALDLRDVETFGHSRTVAKYCQVLAGILGIQDKKVLDNIRRGALLHDVGKIAIPDSILKKPGRLSPPEWDKIRLHPSLGYGLIKEIKLVREAGNIILCHHERYDGTGYPGGLKNRDIPLEARIFALADALDAITTQRPYRKERDFNIAKKEIQSSSGKQFDPEIVDAFCKLPLAQWEKIRFETTQLLASEVDQRALISRS